MFELMFVGAYALTVISVANLTEARPRLFPLLAMLTFGMVNFGGLWRLCGATVRRLSRGNAPAFVPDRPMHRTAAFLLLLGFLNIIVTF